MRKSAKEAAQTRERVVQTAAIELREKGIAGASIADLMAAAGLTHGGFYRHFGSKDEIVAEACASATNSLADWLASILSSAAPGQGLEQLSGAYLSLMHKNNRSQGCPFAALGSELVRADETTRLAATAGLVKMIDLLSSAANDAPTEEAKKESLVTFSTMVGALTLARIVSDSKLSALILSSAKAHIEATAKRM